ncbi:CBS domain-containing protein [Streptomyces sp. NPDC052109]|uniref:CBS domain-containing protein n=1 Tax=Streptomyces sp. NPDC052109 TaxID=3155527 RepID=UPI003443EAAB
MNGIPALVHDVMTRRVVALRGGAAFKDIVRVMQDWHVSALPVLDDTGRVVGVVSEADLLGEQEDGDADTAGIGRHGRTVRLIEAGKADAVTAAGLMTAPAVTVAPDATLARAARLMARTRFKRLPVVGPDGRLRGIVSRSDLLKVFLREDEEIAEEVRREVVVRLFGTQAATVRVEVRRGVVTLTGRVRETALIPLAARLAHAVAGVVDVRCALTGLPRRPALAPDLAGPGVPAPHRARTP